MKKNEQLRDLDVGKLVILESEQRGVFIKDNQIREQKEDLFLAASEPVIIQYLHKCKSE